MDAQPLIVGQAVTPETNDQQPWLPMIATLAQQADYTPVERLADAGDGSDEHLAALAETTIHASISTRQHTHGERPGPCPRGPLPQAATRVARMSRQRHTKAGAAVDAARKAIVEPVLGPIKQARGFRQCLLRGGETVQGDGRGCARHTTF